MELTASPLSYELNLINATTEWGRYYSYEAHITTENEDIDVMKVISMDWIRDYRNACADEVLIQFAMPSGTYLKRVIPFKENLKMTVVKTPIGARPADDPRIITTQEFRAFLVNHNQSDMLGANPQTASEEAANLTGMEIVTFQLQDLPYEQQRSEMVGGIFRDTTPYDLLISLLFKSIQELDTDVPSAVLGVTSVEPNNKVKRSHILIPHGVPLTELAHLLQTQHGGVYSTGCGCYLQRGYWYVWPLYDNTRFDTAEKTTTFIILPDPRFKGTEKTYRATERHLTAVITGGVSMVDASEGSLLNDGNAVRFADSNAMMESFVEKDGNKAVAKRNLNNNEYVGVKRRTDSNMSRVQPGLSKSNVYQESSKLAARSGAFIRMVWENSDPDWLTPDMQCEVGFTVEGAPVFINGIVVHVHAYSALAGTGLHQSAHQVVSEVVVMVDRNSPAYQEFINSKDIAPPTQ